MSTIKDIQESFYLFFRNINPGFTVYPYQKFLIDLIQEDLIVNQDRHKRLLLSMPPGYGKSFLATQLLPAFLLGNDPSLKICICSYSYTIANNLGKLCKQIMQTPEYKAIFPELKITTQGESGMFSTSGGGEVYPVGRGGSITSRRFDIIIVDDAIKDSNEANSSKIMDKLPGWFFSTLVTRFYRTKPTMLLIISTRWHQADITGSCTDNFPDWKYIALDAIATINDPLGRKEGEVLCEPMQTMEELIAIKDADPKNFSALYQNNPVSVDSTYFSNIKICEALKPLKQCLETPSFALTLLAKETPIVTISLDTATTVGSKSDYTVATVFNTYISTGVTIITNIVRTRVAFDDLLSLFDCLLKDYNPDYILVENASSGQQLLQVRPQALPSKVFKNGQDKENYCVTLNSSLGSSFFFEPSALTEELKEELLSYPFGKHDDFVLSLLHGYRFITENKLTKRVKQNGYNRSISMLKMSKRLRNSQ